MKAIVYKQYGSPEVLEHIAKKLNKRGTVIIALLAFFLAAAPLFAQEPAQSITLPSNKRVLIISIDGMRPDVLLRAEAPNIRELMQHGSFTFWAESTDLAITLPTHVSMLTGLTPAKHHITWNDDRKEGPVTRAVPTLFELAKKSGYTTAMVVSKRKLCTIARTSVVDCRTPEKGAQEDATAIAGQSATLLKDRQPQVMFVHFSDPDTVGHALGWGSPEQVVAADRADQGVGILMAALRELGLREQTLVIVTADHGGSGRSHGDKFPFSRYIPWIAAGPGVRENYDLTQEPQPVVHVEDVFATALYFLGIAIPPDTDSKPVLGIFSK